MHSNVKTVKVNHVPKVLKNILYCIKFFVKSQLIEIEFIILFTDGPTDGRTAVLREL